MRYLVERFLIIKLKTKYKFGFDLGRQINFEFKYLNNAPFSLESKLIWMESFANSLLKKTWKSKRSGKREVFSNKLKGWYSSMQSFPIFWGC